MNQVSEDNMQTLFDYAKRPDLDVQTAKFMREFDSLQLYEVLKR